MAYGQTSCCWVSTDNSLETIAEFFVSNVSTEYISHGEIIDGRALSESEWSPDLKRIMLREFSACVEHYRDRTLRLAIMNRNDELLALSIVGLVGDFPEVHAWIHDLVVKRDLRGSGIGAKLLSWVEEQLRSEGVPLVFIESGVSNTNAHSFFERFGYIPCSQVMKKVL